MFRILFLTIGILLIGTSVFGDVGDCLWGGRNEETAYTSTYIPGMGGTTLAQLPPPPMNLGAPQPSGIPVQASPNSQAMTVQQANIPTITIPNGLVGSVGRPAVPGTLPQAPPGTEIVYVMPSSLPSEAVCINGTKSIPASEAKIVPANTPGAIPVALKKVMVRRPKTESHWTYSPVVNKTETLVKVVDSRTGRVVRTFCREDEERSFLPWLHRQETVSYETVEAVLGTPVSLNPTAASATNTAVQSSAIPYQSRYPSEPTAFEGGAVQQTIILP